LWDAGVRTVSGANITISTVDASTQLAFTADLRATVQQIRNAVVARTGLLRFDLFAQGAEDKLQACVTAGSLVGAPGGSVALFLLQTPGPFVRCAVWLVCRCARIVHSRLRCMGQVHCLGWCWDKCGKDITLSGEGLVAKKTFRRGAEAWRLVTSSQPMTEGRHYWEVEITNDPSGSCAFFVGAVRPGLDHDKAHQNSNDAYSIFTADGTDEQGKFFALGDRVGVLLDLNAGWLRFYRNGMRYGPGYTEGVTGPLVRAAEMQFKGSVLTALPGAAAPEDPTGVDSAAAQLDVLVHPPWG
jgi:hypothetical protein